MNITAPVGNTVQFTCTAEGVIALTYLVNSMTIAEVASIGVFQSTVNDGSQINAYLHFPVTSYINSWPVVAIAFLPDETRVYSPPAYLHVQGLCQCNVYVSVQMISEKLVHVNKITCDLLIQQHIIAKMMQY